MSKPDETERLEEDADDAADHGSSVIDYVMAPSDSPAADDIAGAVELDSFQAKEIRTIFFTTLPEYLEPVEQMVEQLLDPAGAAPEVRDPLCATLSSISQAATRIGIDEVPAVLDRMRGRIAPMGPEPASRELRERILADLDDIRSLVENATGTAPARSDHPRAQTIVAALRDLPELDDSVVTRLTTAGLLTVDQLQVARPDEIVAVSGLGREVVDRLLAALFPPTAEAAPEPGGSEPGSLRGRLEECLRAQVDAEASLEATRASMARLRARKNELARELASAERERDDLVASLARSAALVAERMGELAELRTAGRELAERKAMADENVLRLEQRIAGLERERQVLVADLSAIGREVAALSERVHTMLRSTLLT